MLLVACYKQHDTIHDATLLKATVACYKVASCMVAFMRDHKVTSKKINGLSKEVCLIWRVIRK